MPAWYVPFSTPGLAAEINQPGWWTPERREALRQYNLAMAQAGPSWKERWRRFTISATKLAIAWAWNRLVRRMEQPWRTVKAYFKFLDTVDTVALEQCWEETPEAKPLHGLLVDVLTMRDNRKFRNIQGDRLKGWDE